LYNSYGRDKRNVYYKLYKLQGANVRRWRSLNSLYSQDDDQVFFENHPLRNASPQHFFVLTPHQPHFAYDGKHFFCNGRLSSSTEYAENLERLSADYAEYAITLRSGRWEELRHAETRPYRSPEETPPRLMLSHSLESCPD